MLKELSYIKLSGRTLPIKIDNLVLQEVQQEYGTLMSFEMRLIGAVFERDEEGNVKAVQKEPDVSVTNFVLPKMIREGYAVLKEECPYNEEEIIRMIDENIYIMADTLHEEYRKCMGIKEPKKQIPNQTESRNRSNLIGSILLAVQSWVSRRRRSIKCILGGLWIF